MATDRPTWRSRVWLVAAVVLAVLALALMGAGSDRPVSLSAALLVAGGFTVSVVSWAFTRSRSQRRRYEDELEVWAAEGARQAERLRIAGDLHDLVSHGLGLITVRAAAAVRVTGSDGPAERAIALTDIERISRETTTELRRMLDVLHRPGQAPFRPADSLDDLPAIVQAARDAGLTATLGVGDLGDVTPGVQLALSAVIREALNNTLRHAGPTQVRVGLQRDGEAITVEVRDAGPQGDWQPQPGAGHGLDGLRQRVTALGGTLKAGHDVDGFRLTARIPDRDRP